MEKKIFWVGNREEAKQFIGKRCWFSDFYDELKERKGSIGTLAGVLEDINEMPFFRTVGVNGYRYCTPVDETRVRPYENFEEMAKDAVKHGIERGEQSFIVRSKSDNTRYKVALIRNGVTICFFYCAEDVEVSFAELAEGYNWNDGAPCEVEEES